MPTPTQAFNSKQVLYREMVLGTLVYSVVLGFFNDYTPLLTTSSYSVTFLVAVVMQALTHMTFQLKNKIANYFKQKSGRLSKAALVVSVWLVLFLSKFVFLAVIDFVFGQYVEISGFIGLLAIILTMTIAKQLIDYIFDRLAD